VKRPVVPTTLVGASVNAPFPGPLAQLGAARQISRRIIIGANPSQLVPSSIFRLPLPKVTLLLVCIALQVSVLSGAGLSARLSGSPPAPVAAIDRLSLLHPSGSPDVSPAIHATSIPVGWYPSDITFDDLNGDVYVSNYYGGTVSVISGTSNSVIATVHVGSYPQALVCDTGNGDVYVVSSGDDNVSVISGASNTVVATVPVGGQMGNNPDPLAYDPINGEIYVGNTHTNNVSVISGATNLVVANVAVGQSPQVIVLDTTTDALYVANGQSNNVSVISGSTNKVMANVDVGGDPYAEAFDAANGNIYVADPVSSAVSVISGATNSLLTTVVVPGGPQGVVFDAGSGDVYVAVVGSSPSYIGNVTVISGATNSIVANITVWIGPFSEVNDSANGDVYVVNSNPGGIGRANVSVIDVASDTVAATLNVGQCPCTEVYDSTNHEVYVTSMPWDNVTVLNGSSPPGPSLRSFNVQPASVGIGNWTNFTVYVTGGSGTLSYQYAGLPQGCASADLTTLACRPGLPGTYSTRVYVNDTAGNSVNATAVLTVTRTGLPRFDMTFNEVPPTCTFSFNGTVVTNGSSAMFPVGNYTAVASACPGYVFHEWSYIIAGIPGLALPGPLGIFVHGNGSVEGEWSPAPGVRWTILFSVNSPVCSPVEFNGTSVANGTSGEFPSGTYPAYAPACSGRTFSQLTFRGSAGWSQVFLTTWSNITVSVNGTLWVNYTAQTITTVSLSPASATLGAGRNMTFTATTVCTPGPCARLDDLWSLSNGLGTVSSMGTGSTATFTAGLTAGAETLWVNVSFAPYVIVHLTATAVITILSANPPILQTSNTTIEGGPVLMDGQSYTVWANVTNAGGFASVATGTSVRFYAQTSAGGNPTDLGGPDTWFGFVGGIENSSAQVGSTANIYYNHTDRAYVRFAVGTDLSGQYQVCANATSPSEFEGSYKTGANVDCISVEFTPPPLVAFANATYVQGGRSCAPSGEPVSQVEILTGAARGGSAPYSWSWTFGDGTAAEETQNATHTYTSLGPFEAELRVNDSLGAHAFANSSSILIAYPPCAAPAGPVFSILGLGALASVVLIVVPIALAVLAVSVIVLRGRLKKQGPLSRPVSETEERPEPSEGPEPPPE
jgi:YVTN family beta-propeller protein